MKNAKLSVQRSYVKACATITQLASLICYCILLRLKITIQYWTIQKYLLIYVKRNRIIFELSLKTNSWFLDFLITTLNHLQNIFIISLNCVLLLRCCTFKIYLKKHGYNIIQVKVS